MVKNELPGDGEKSVWRCQMGWNGGAFPCLPSSRPCLLLWANLPTHQPTNQPTNQPNFRPNDVWTEISHLTVLPCLVHAWTTSWERREANVACVEDKLYLLCEWLLFFDISAIYRLLFGNSDRTCKNLHRRNYNIESSSGIFFARIYIYKVLIYGYGETYLVISNCVK